MPRIISFTTADKLETALMDTGVYPVVIPEIDGPKTSKSGKGQNYWTKFRITSGRYTGKELMACFGTSISAETMAGNLQMFPDHAFDEIDAVIKGKKPSLEDGTVDIDTLINKPFCISVGVLPQKDGGKINNIITGFLPAGTDKAATPF